MRDIERGVSEHYASYDVLARIRVGLVAMGHDPDAEQILEGGQYPRHYNRRGLPGPLGAGFHHGPMPREHCIDVLGRLDTPRPPPTHRLDGVILLPIAQRRQANQMATARRWAPMVDRALAVYEMDAIAVLALRQHHATSLRVAHSLGEIALLAGLKIDSEGSDPAARVA